MNQNHRSEDPLVGCGDITDHFEGRNLGACDKYRILLADQPFIYDLRIASGGGWDIFICDYLENAPDDVLWDLVLQIEHRFLTKERGLPESYQRYINSKENLMEIQSTFIERNPSYKGTPIGTHKNLMDEVKKLLFTGLISYEDIRNARFTWACFPDPQLMGFCHGDWRIVGITDFLDCKEQDPRILNHTVYHEILHLRQQNLGILANHDQQFHEWVSKHPFDDRADGACSKIESARLRMQESLGEGKLSVETEKE